MVQEVVSFIFSNKVVVKRGFMWTPYVMAQEVVSFIFSNKVVLKRGFMWTPYVMAQEVDVLSKDGGVVEED